MTYEIWNEPWIYEWTWADTPSEFRKLQIMTAKMLQKNRPGVRILAGNSVMFFLDNLEPYPESWRGLVDGLTHHPYCSATGEPNYHCLDQQRSIDFGMVESRRLGIDYYYLTEGGTHYGRDGKSNLIENAIKVVQYNTMAALSGTFQSNVQWGIGIGFDYELSNEAYKVMSYLLEDRPIMADVFPSSELLYGALFAHPRNGTDAIRKLARGRS